MSQFKLSLDNTKRFALVVAVAVALGAAGALVTFAFIRLLDWLTELVWTWLPKALGVSGTGAAFVIVTCTIGGVAVGYARRYLGDNPLELQQALKIFRDTHRFDYRHLPNAIVISLASLVFGAALGPESILVAIVGGVSTFVVDRIKHVANYAWTISYVGISGALGALFGSPFGSAALPIETSDGDRLPKLWTYVPGLLSAFAGVYIFKLLANGGYLDFDFLPYTFSASDLLIAVPVAIACALSGTLYLVSLFALDYVAGRIGGLVIKATLGGIVLGFMGTVSYLVLFSGRNGIQTLLTDNEQLSTAYLFGIGILKLFAASWCLAMAWKGGRFFPLMFAGAAIGLGIAHGVSGVPDMVGIAVGMTAGLAAVIQKPIAVALLMLLIFPLDLWAIAVIAALVGSAVGVGLKSVSRHPEIFGGLEGVPESKAA